MVTAPFDRMSATRFRWTNVGFVSGVTTRLLRPSLSHAANDASATAVLSDAQSVRRDLPLHFFLERYTESFVAELKVFVDAVLRDLPVPVTGADARAPVVMGLAARKSYDEHRPVRLSEIVG